LSDILSQTEIAELLDAVKAGGGERRSGRASPAANATLYDFKTANRFPKEQIRTINIIFQTFSQLFSNSLSITLRTVCECEFISAEEYSFNEFINTLPAPVLLAVISANPMQGSLLLELPPTIAYMIISRLFGGASSGGAHTLAKQFTEIERTLIERVLRNALTVFDEAWDKVLKLDSHIERLATSAQDAQIVDLNEPVALVELGLKIGSESGTIRFCIPHTAVIPIVKQLNPRQWYSSSLQDGGDPHPSDQMTGKLVHVPVNLTAFFDQTPATIADIVNLQVGDVIHLRHRTDQPITVNVQHIPKFRAIIGAQGERAALQIVDIIKEEDS
jgi:flagellar motor switch protein FliM